MKERKMQDWKCRTKCQGVKMQDLKMRDQKTRTGKWRTNGRNVCSAEEKMRDCVVEKTQL